MLMPFNRGGKLRFAAGVLFALIAAALTALTGNGAKLPLDTHEVFVARSAEEMLARGSFLVPYLNDQPRLKKPPLSYWLVMAIDRLNGSDGVITEMEARLPSIIGGILLAALTCALGTVFFGRVPGVLAGFLLAGSGGFVTYTHSARPEMLYAMFCTAGVLGFALSFHKHQLADSRSKWFAWIGWLMMGLAMLTKGPQLPLPIVAGWILAMLLAKRAADIRPVLRPFSGLLIMLAVSLWWYVALWKVIPNAWEIWRIETIERMSPANVPKSLYFDPFYLYRTAQLMLPWVVFFGLAGAAPWLKEFKTNRPARILWWMVVTPMIVLSLWLGRRDYYMLPTTGIAAVLMTAAAVAIGRDFFSTSGAGAWIWKTVLALHIAVLAAAAIAMRCTEPLLTKPPMWTLVATTAAAACALLIILRPRVPEAQTAADPSELNAAPSDSLLAATLCVGIVFFVSMAANVSLWQIDRISRRDFSIAVGRAIPVGEPLLGWEDIWEVDQYYLHHAIPSYAAKREILAALRDMTASQPGRAAWVLVSTRDDPRRQRLELPEEFHIDRVLGINDPLDAGEMQLWRVTSEH